MKKSILSLVLIGSLALVGCVTDQSQIASTLGKITTAVTSLPASTGVDITAGVQNAAKLVGDLVPKQTIVIVPPAK